MRRWVARYEEGYVTSSGVTVVLVDEFHRSHPWRDPREARKHWSKRPDLQGPDVTHYENGLMQRDFVHDRAEFARLDVVEIWRRVTFLAIHPGSE